MQNALMTVGGSSVNVHDVLSFMKLNGSYNDAKRFVVMNEVIKDHAKHEGMNFEDDTLQAFSDLKRYRLGLLNSGDMNKYLNNLGITADDWEDALEGEMYRFSFASRNGGQIQLMDAWKLLRGIPAVRSHLVETFTNVANTHGVSITDEELQHESDVIRRVMGMHNSNEFNAVIGALGMNQEDWENYLHAEIAYRKLASEGKAPNLANELKTALRKYPAVESILSNMVFSQIIHAKAKRANIKVSEDELQDYVNNFRRALGLHTVNSFSTWLDATGMTLENFEYMAETELIKKHFADKNINLFDDSAIENHIKTTNQFSSAADEVKMLTFLSDKAANNNMTVTDEDINQESDYLRRANGLHKAEDFKNFLDSRGISLDFWEWYCEKSSLVRKLYDSKTTNDQIITAIESDDNFRIQAKRRTFGRWVETALQDMKIQY